MQLIKWPPTVTRWRLTLLLLLRPQRRTARLVTRNSTPSIYHRCAFALRQSLRPPEPFIARAPAHTAGTAPPLEASEPLRLSVLPHQPTGRTPRVDVLTLF